MVKDLFGEGAGISWGGAAMRGAQQHFQDLEQRTASLKKCR